MDVVLSLPDDDVHGVIVVKVHEPVLSFRLVFEIQSDLWNFLYKFYQIWSQRSLNLVTLSTFVWDTEGSRHETEFGKVFQKLGVINTVLKERI